MCLCRAVILSFLMIVLLGGCGWKTMGTKSYGWTVGFVEGSSLAPGFKTRLRDEVRLASARRGVRAGPNTLQVHIISDGEDAAGRLSTGSTVAFDTNLVIRLGVVGRRGCEVELEMRRFWVVPPDFPLWTQEQRARTLSELAGTLARRGIDALISEERCHSSET